MIKTLEGSNVYRNKCLRKGFDPSRGRTTLYHLPFYKHAIPPGLKT